MIRIENKDMGKVITYISGRILFVDLEHQKLKQKVLGKDVIYKYLGGRGINAYLLSNLNSEKAGENKSIIISAGLLTGTIPFSRTCLSYVNSNNRIEVVKLPGAIGIEMKMAGFDHLVIGSESSLFPVILSIRNDIVNYYKASDVWDDEEGRLSSNIKEIEGDDHLEVIVTAGSSAIFSPYSHDGRDITKNNLRSRFNAKNLKAVSLRGTKGFGIYDIEGYKSSLKKLLTLFDSQFNTYLQNGTDTGKDSNLANRESNLVTPELPLCHSDFEIIKDCLGIQHNFNLNTIIELVHNISGVNYTINDLSLICKRVKAAEEKL